MSAPAPAPAPAPDQTEVIAQRLSEASQIEQEWNALSFKDRATWWMSAKWYGCMSSEAYRRGDPLNADISCRYGEPGFFIATRVPYYEVQAELSIATAASTSEITPLTATESEPEPKPESEPKPQPEPEPKPEPEPVTIIATTNDQEKEKAVPSNIFHEANTDSISEKPTPIQAVAQTSNPNSQKKKKKKHHSKPTNPGDGKTIEIRLAGQSK